jgi:hypothetical protein
MMYSATKDWHRSALVTFIAEVFFLVSLTCTKLSVLLFYRRLVKGTYSDGYKYSLWFGMFLAAVAFAVPLGMLVTSCSPVKALWWQWDMPYIYANAYKFHCRPIHTIVLVSQFTGAISVATDFYSVMLPLLVLAKIQMNRRQRVGLMGIFGLSFM